jgi:hypothetical protein
MTSIAKPSIASATVATARPLRQNSDAWYPRQPSGINVNVAYEFYVRDVVGAFAVR